MFYPLDIGLPMGRALMPPSLRVSLSVLIFCPNAINLGTGMPMGIQKEPEGMTPLRRNAALKR